MKRLLILVPLAALVAACSQSANIPSDNLYKEAVLRSRDVYQIDMNVDGNNEAVLNFITDFEGQLVEVNFSTKAMNDFFYTLNNTDKVQKRKKYEGVEFSELLVELNGSDITPCLIAECSSTNCHGPGGALEKFSGEMSTASMFLNLQKLDKMATGVCTSVTLAAPGELNQLVFKEASTPNLPTSRGGRLMAQVIVYKRSYLPTDMPMGDR